MINTDVPKNAMIVLDATESSPYWRKRFLVRYGYMCALCERLLACGARCLVHGARA